MYISNPIVNIDSYKLAHRNMYPQGTELVYSNFTPRSGKHFKGPKDGVIHFGTLGMMTELNEAFIEGFFCQPLEQVLDEYRLAVAPFMGKSPDQVDVSHIKALHELGYLPIELKALDEGQLVSFGVPVFTIKNTKPGFYWLTNYLETWLSTEGWKAMTSATSAYYMKRLLLTYAVKTGADQSFIEWQGHDFSMRGMSGIHDAARSGAGHLTSFWGSDTITAADYLKSYYDGAECPVLAGSVPASEHSVMTIGGTEGEWDMIDRIIFDVHPTGIVSVVSDSFDFWDVMTNYTRSRKDRILARGVDGLGMAKVVFRPDSGDPVKILTGYKVHEFLPEALASDVYDSEYQPGKFEVEILRKHAINIGEVEAVKIKGRYYEMESSTFGRNGETFICTFTRELPEAEVRGAVECLWDVFGGTKTDHGYKVLNQRVGLIYGDSITLRRAEQILDRLKAKGFASTNCVFGVGSYTYQYQSRDTLGFAMKATYAIVNGKECEIFKAPKTDPGKNSAKGLLRVDRDENGEIRLYDQQTSDQEQQGLLKTLFKDGIFDPEYCGRNTLLEIRRRINLQM